ncbi:MAG: DNA polymerase III subunit delta [Bdellovibrionales bacterium]|nr:DNA polymerase III subunit delta [Bdellovibrionales bacterium]
MDHSKPVYVAIEAESYQMRCFVEELQQKLYPQGDHQQHKQQFDLKTDSIDQVFDAANTLSMFSPHTLIFCKSSKALNEKQEEKLLQHLENAGSQSTVVFELQKLDKRKKLYKALAKAQVLLEFTKPKAHEMQSWASKMAIKRGLQIESKAANLLAEHIGDDIPRMHSELEKLELFIHPDKNITQNHVLAMTVKTSGDHVFAFTDQMIEKKSAKALTALHFLLAEGTPALMLVGMIARHLRILIRTFEALERRIPRPGLAKEIGIPPFTVARYESQCRKISKKDCYRYLGDLARLDRELKSTGLPSSLLLEQTVRQISS